MREHERVVAVIEPERQSVGTGWPACGARTCRRTSFGRDCLTLQGHDAAFLHGDRLVLKLPAPTAVALLECGEAVPARMGQRVMRA